MKRPWITALNVLLGVGALALLGLSIANVAEGFLTDQEAAVSAPTPAAAASGGNWADRARIIDRNLFNVSTLAPAADTLEEAESYEKTRLPLRLLGTAAAGEASWAAVEDLESRKHLVARVGGPLKGATVLRIDRCRIVLQNAGRREELSLETPAGCFEGSPRAAASGAPLAVARGRGGVQASVQRLAENRFAVPRAEVENAAANPAALFSQARILPRYDQGKMVGVQLNSIRPGSLFAQVGIQDGDTVTQVNGVTVATPEDSQRVLEQFAAGGALSVTVTGRDGQVRELEYVAQ